MTNTLVRQNFVEMNFAHIQYRSRDKINLWKKYIMDFTKSKLVFSVVIIQNGKIIKNSYFDKPVVRTKRTSIEFTLIHHANLTVSSKLFNQIEQPLISL